MLYLHDVWVNWFEGEENGYNICSFHEWRTSDGIEILDQVPVLYIDKETFHTIENDLHDIPKEILEQIYKRAYIRKNQERKVLEYACVVTDGRSILAFDTMGYQIPIRKSRLIPRQERLVLELIEGREVKTYHNNEPGEKEFHILSLPPESMMGLTRRERQLKQLLMIALDQLQVSKCLEEIRYWLTEWQPENYAMIKNMNFKEAWTHLYNDLVTGWSHKHEAFCRQIMKGQAFYENILEEEQNNRTTKSVK
ncbi:Protein of unknown function [Gracilibacillus ureilyticus]|uniref:Uncharacterized protein n=1 Tax=Gracilibacillus ureilyticus TaxID=531814 RepID=A0A1H9SNY7_9BACI|nr:DUF3603 family protein [Gracilibacillus ureilyticus]SER86720.1 Protein of unknown function [Gracilibacillus ureilyticus]